MTQELRFQGRVALVTGAGGGLGAASARRLAHDGAHVALIDIDKSAVEEVVATLPGEHLAIEADISDEGAVDTAFSRIVARFGRIDLHHLNAGIMGSFDVFPLLSVAEFDRVMAVNVRGTFLGIRAAFRQYSRQQSGGAIVVTASIASTRGSHDVVAYQTSKHATMGLVRAAAMYGGPLAIRTNAVAPGLIPTDLHASGTGRAGGGSDIEQRGTTVPLRRTGRPEEVAEAVAFLLSDAAAYINGESVAVDGGSAIQSTVRPSGGAGRWDSSEIDEQIREAQRKLRRPEHDN